MQYTIKHQKTTYLPLALVFGFVVPVGEQDIRWLHNITSQSRLFYQLIIHTQNILLIFASKPVTSDSNLHGTWNYMHYADHSYFQTVFKYQHFQMHFHASFYTNLAQRQSLQSVHGNVNLSNVDDETCTHVQSSYL